VENVVENAAAVRATVVGREAANVVATGAPVVTGAWKALPKSIWIN
jgi:hypothetical protein